MQEDDDVGAANGTGRIWGGNGAPQGQLPPPHTQFPSFTLPGAQPAARCYLSPCSPKTKRGFASHRSFPVPAWLWKPIQMSHRGRQH